MWLGFCVTVAVVQAMATGPVWLLAWKLPNAALKRPEKKNCLPISPSPGFPFLRLKEHQSSTNQKATLRSWKSGAWGETAWFLDMTVRACDHAFLPEAGRLRTLSALGQSICLPVSGYDFALGFTSAGMKWGVILGSFALCIFIKTFYHFHAASGSPWLCMGCAWEGLQVTCLLFPVPHPYQPLPDAHVHQYSATVNSFDENSACVL